MPIRTEGMPTRPRPAPWHPAERVQSAPRRAVPVTRWGLSTPGRGRRSSGRERGREQTHSLFSKSGRTAHCELLRREVRPQAAWWSAPGPSRPFAPPLPTQEAHGCSRQASYRPHQPPQQTRRAQQASGPSLTPRIWGRGGGWVCGSPHPCPPQAPSPLLAEAGGKSSPSAEPGAGYIWMLKVMTHLHAALPPICLTR